MSSLWMPCKLPVSIPLTYQCSLFIPISPLSPVCSDPQVQVDIVTALYDGGPFLTSLPNGLRDDGILIAQVGEAAKMIAPGEEHSWHRNRVKFIETLINTGFESVRDYEEVSTNRFNFQIWHVQWLTFSLSS